MIVRAALLAFAVVAGGCAMESPYVPPPLTGEGTPLHPPEEAWARVLKASVDQAGRIDFNAVLANHEDLDRYVAWIYERSPERWPEFYRTRAQVIAYHVNAYNALTIYNLLTAGVPGELASSDRKKLFQFRKLLVGGQPMSLDEYHENVIRALGEPRLHFAVTRLVAGDPVLAREPYRASTLDQQLDRAARAFFADTRNLSVDRERRRITLSPLMELYAADFLRVAPSLTAYADAFTDAPLPEGYAVEFTDFDWTVRWKSRR
ncbi:MAG: DUF547 domain-containing protein [Gammaproteobacteria bacterium]